MTLRLNSTLGPTFNTVLFKTPCWLKPVKAGGLGGLLDDFLKQVSKVPLLGDIPLVGQLFRYTSTEALNAT